MRTEHADAVRHAFLTGASSEATAQRSPLETGLLIALGLVVLALLVWYALLPVRPNPRPDEPLSRWRPRPTGLR